MARPANESELQSRIEAFIEETKSIVRKALLESVRDALGHGVAPARRGKPRPAAPKALAVSRACRKRTTEQVEELAQRVRDHVKANPGQGVERIAGGLRVSTKQLALPIQKLIASRSLVAKGRKRGTKYFVAGAAVARKAKPGRKARTKPKTASKPRPKRKSKRKSTRKRQAKSKPKSKLQSKRESAHRPKPKRKATPKRRTRRAQKRSSKPRAQHTREPRSEVKSPAKPPIAPKSAPTPRPETLARKETLAGSRVGVPALMEAKGSPTPILVPTA
jgi:hypothetical protein